MCKYRGRGCILIEVGAQTDYLFQMGNGNLFSSVRKHCPYLILPFEYWVSIQVNKNCPILGNFRWLWKSVYNYELFPFAAKRSALTFKPSNLFQKHWSDPK